MSPLVGIHISSTHSVLLTTSVLHSRLVVHVSSPSGCGEIHVNVLKVWGKDPSTSVTVATHVARPPHVGGTKHSSSLVSSHVLGATSPVKVKCE